MTNRRVCCHSIDSIQNQVSEAELEHDSLLDLSKRFETNVWQLIQDPWDSHNGYLEVCIATHIQLNVKYSRAETQMALQRKDAGRLLLKPKLDIHIETIYPTKSSQTFNRPQVAPQSQPQTAPQQGQRTDRSRIPVIIVEGSDIWKGLQTKIGIVFKMRKRRTYCKGL